MPHFVSRRDFTKTVGVSALSLALGSDAKAEAVGNEPLTHLSAKKLAGLIAAREVSATEVVTAYLNRIEEVNPKINAVFQVDPERILAAARKADDELRRGLSIGPLHGVPFTMKDQFLTKGIITTNGCPELRAYVPKEDATVVKRLIKAGGILLGKTNVPEMCTLGITDNLVYGRTNNPYDLSRTPQGSSGGEAAIIAAGGSAFGIGTDIGGSIRGPSHFCGIAGIKATSCRVPETGMLGAFPPSATTWNGIGPMARYVEDLELTLPLISGPDGIDYYTVPGPRIRKTNEVPVDKLKVAYFLDDEATQPSDETRAVVEVAAKELQSAGLTVTQDRPSGLGRVQELWKQLLIPTWEITAHYWLREYARIGQTEVVRPRFFINEVGFKWLDYMHENNDWSDERRFQLEMELHEFREGMLAFMQDYDVMLSPVMNAPAVPHPTPDEIESIPLAELFAEPIGGFCMMHNLTGWPAAVVRAGGTTGGLPISVQIAAKPWKEDMALAVAAVIESRLGGWQPPVGL